MGTTVPQIYHWIDENLSNGRHAFGIVCSSEERLKLILKDYEAIGIVFIATQGSQYDEWDLCVEWRTV